MNKSRKDALKQKRPRFFLRGYKILNPNFSFKLINPISKSNNILCHVLFPR